MKHDDSNRARTALPQVAWPAFLADALRSSSQRHEHLRRRCAKKISKRSIHDLRIETRRQLALATLAGEVCGAPIDRLRRSLKRYLHGTAKLRDAEVQLEFVDEMVSQYPEIRTFRRHLRRTVDRRIGETETKLRRRKKKLSMRVRALAAAVLVPSETRQAGPAIVFALRGALTAVQEVSLAAQPGDEQMHQARLALKRLRYMAEALRGVVPGISAGWIERLRRSQSAMGDIHDLQILAHHLAQQTARRPRERSRLRHFQTILAGRKKRLQRGYRSRLPPPPAQLRRIIAV